MSRRRQSGIFTARISHNILMWQEMVGLILVFFLNGNSCWPFVREVKYPPLISAWEGSCTLLKCEYIIANTNRQLTNLTWYKDPLYSDSEKKWTGTIVHTYVEGQTEIDKMFMSRVKFQGDLKKDCTLLIKDLLILDSGNYSVRLEDGNEKWMSSPYLTLNVSVSPPEPRIEVLTTVRESQRAIVTCSVDYSCHETYPIKLHWDVPMQASKTMDYDKTTIVWKLKNTLEFDASWEHNKKSLRCYLSSSKDSTKTSASEIVLNVEYAPKIVQVITVEPSPTIKEGESVTLRCHVNSSNPHVTEYRWFKNNLKQTQTVSTMQITGASAKDAGNYSCAASNSIGSVTSQPLEVVVHFAPREAKVKKDVAENIIEGISVTLSCTTKCNPPATDYDWYKDDHRLSNSEKDLKFQQTSADDSGYYRCNVYCPMGNISSLEEYVNVMYAPKNVALSIRSPDPDLIKEGDTVRLGCTYNSSNPEVSMFIWYFNSVTWQQTENNEIEIQLMKPAAAGKYSCAAENKAGLSSAPAVQVDVKYAPKNVKLQVAAPSTLQEGHYAQLKCHVEASNPIVNKYTWFKDDHIYADLHGSELTFPELKSSDSGSYTCKAVNDIDATMSQPVQVTVQYAPRNVVVSVDPPTRIIEDSNISLICSCDAEPEADRYTWYKMSRFHLNTRGRRLLFYSITREQSGQYQCEAKNSLASRRSDVINLAVHYSSKTIVKMVAIVAGLLVFLLLIVVILRFRLWKKLQIQKIYTGGESDDRSDTFFVVNRKQSPEDHQDELNNTAAAIDPEYEESVNYAGIQFPSNHVIWETMPPRGCISNRSSVTLKNKEEPPICSLMQKPTKPSQQMQAVSQDGFRNTAMSLDPEKDESINYSIIHFPPKHTKDEAALTSAYTNNRRSVTLQNNEESAIYSVMQKPCKPLQMKEPSIDYENVSKKTEADIEYCTITNLKCKPTNENESDSESDFEDMGAPYAELKH